MAAGDPNQSIFAFNKQYPHYLLELAGRDDFKTFPLEKNHRSDPSIINYSLRLLSHSSYLLPEDGKHIYHKEVKGSEKSIAQWLDQAVPFYESLYDVSKRNRIAVLMTDGKRTNDLIRGNIGIPCKPIVKTDLDHTSSSWGMLFKKILYWLFSSEETKYELVEKYLSLQIENRNVIRLVIEHLHQIENEDNPIDSLDDIVRVAELLLPLASNEVDIQVLQSILDDEELLSAFRPAETDEIQLLTLHSSKGLEFDIVFHLNLYKYILPQENKSEQELEQFLNLHYVGITRAKKCCVLCSSTKRHNWENRIYNAEPSPFLSRHNIDTLRIPSPI